MHFTGALLLDPRDAALLDEHLQYRPQAEAEAQPAPPAGEGAAAMEEGGGGAWGDEDGGYYPGDDAPMQEPGGTPLRALGHDGEEEEEEADPWEPLDYNDPDGAFPKPRQALSLCVAQAAPHIPCPAPPRPSCAPLPQGPHAAPRRAARGWAGRL